MNLSNDVLNYGLALSVEFGKKWLTPINQRLQNAFSNLSKEEPEECNSICKEVNKTAHQFVYNSENLIKKDLNFAAFEAFDHFIKQKYSWISLPNIERLYSQSCYYAIK